MSSTKIESFQTDMQDRRQLIQANLGDETVYQSPLYNMGAVKLNGKFSVISFLNKIIRRSEKKIEHLNFLLLLLGHTIIKKTLFSRRGECCNVNYLNIT